MQSPHRGSDGLFTELMGCGRFEQGPDSPRIEALRAGRADIGFVPRENLIGPAVLIYWNSEAQKFSFVFPE